MKAKTFDVPALGRDLLALVERWRYPWPLRRMSEPGWTGDHDPYAAWRDLAECNATIDGLRVEAERAYKRVQGVAVHLPAHPEGSVVEGRLRASLLYLATDGVSCAARLATLMGSTKNRGVAREELFAAEGTAPGSITSMYAALSAIERDVRVLVHERITGPVETAAPKAPVAAPTTVVLWAGAEHSKRNVTLARSRTAFLEANGNAQAALAALASAGHGIGQSTLYDHLNALDTLDPNWRRHIQLSGLTGNPEAHGLTRTRGKR